MSIHESTKFGRIDLTALVGVQTALQCLGFEPGAVDGVDGPNTQTAVRAFQTARGLEADGIVGPATREAIANALRDAVLEDVAENTGLEG